MYFNISQLILDYGIDYLFMGFGYPIIWLAQLFMFIAEPLFFWLLPALVLFSLAVSFNNQNSPIYWKSIQKSPPKAFDKAFKHPVFKCFARIYINAIMYMFVIMALLTFLTIMSPTEEGIHVIDMIRQPHILLSAIGSLTTICICAVSLKVLFYVQIGFVDSLGNFKLKMIFR